MAAITKIIHRVIGHQWYLVKDVKGNYIQRCPNCGIYRRVRK